MRWKNRRCSLNSKPISEAHTIEVDSTITIENAYAEYSGRFSFGFFRAAVVNDNQDYMCSFLAYYWRHFWPLPIDQPMGAWSEGVSQSSLIAMTYEGGNMVNHVKGI